MNNIIKELKYIVDAYENCLENDFCTEDFPEYEGYQPSEIINKILQLIKTLEEI